MNSKINKKLLSFVIAGVILQGCGGGSSTKTEDGININHSEKIDIQKPHISLNGDKTMLVNIGDKFIDPGANAVDNFDGDISRLIITEQNPTIDTSKSGSYKIIYKVSDKAGNEDIVKRTVVVLDVINNPQSKKESGIVINEVLAMNSNSGLDPDFKQFSDWIELYNNSNNDIDISGYYLSDDPKNPKKWQIPSNTTLQMGSYLTIWADKEDINKQALHTNFSLNEKGETLILSNSSGIEIDKVMFKKQKRDISLTSLGAVNYYMDPTPSLKNGQAINALYESDKPIFDKESGFYNGKQEIILSQDNGADIYYTTDGSTPTKQSNKYVKPISISKTTVIRARAFEGNKFLSSVVNHTFLIDEDVHLPVVSVAIDEKYLFDSEIGIYTEGNNLNYMQNWSRPGSVEYIKDGKSQFSKNVGIKIHGNNTRSYPQKSLAIYSKDKYESKSINYPLFEDKPYIKEVKSFVLRSGGTDWPYAIIKDGIVHRIVKDTMDIDIQSFQSTVVFINGRYWGIHNVREKMNADYLEANHPNIDSKKVDLIANGDEVKDGTGVDYKSLIDYIDTHDLSNDAIYNEVISQIDLTEVMNYMISESFSANNSISHNIKCWKEQGDNGKWRWLLFDLDRGFGYLDEGGGLLEYIMDDDPTTLLFNKLLRNKKFVNLFASHYFTHVYTTFETQRMNKIITKAKDTIADEIPRHFSRWSRDQKGKELSESKWSSYIDKIYDFSTYRQIEAIDQLRGELNLIGNKILNINPSEHGTITINGVKVSGTFNNIYFNGAEVILKAIPKSGYKFVEWSNGNKEQSINVVLNSDVTIGAVFESTKLPKIVINEFNFSSSSSHDSGDWIEIYNNDSLVVDLSNWIIKDDSPSLGFTIPQNTILEPNGYLVVCKNRAKFDKQYSIQGTVLGDFSFGLNSREDSINLYNKQGSLIDHVDYNKDWTLESSGKTLSLIDPNSDNNVNSNWSLTDNFGTPNKVN